MRASRYPLWSLILAGYLAASRQFAYLGVSPLFIGEAYLGWNIFRNRGNWQGRFLDNILRGELLSVAIAVNLLWGLVEVFRCLFLNKSPFEVIRLFALSYYPIYLLVGISIAREMSIAQFVRAWKIVLCIYAVYVLVADLAMPDLGMAGLPSAVPAAMFALWPYLRKWWPRYLVLFGVAYPVVFSHGHNRGGFLGFVVGLVMVGVVSGANFARLAAISAAVLIVGLVVGPYIPGPTGQTPPLDPSVHVARVIATFDPKMAEQLLDARGYHDEAAVVATAEGTAEWRKRIWRNAVHSLNTTSLVMMGQGGGASIQDLVPDHQEIHTPHNFLVFCLYYTGAVGVAVYCFLLISVVLVARRVENLAFRSLLLGVIVATVMMALVGDCFETPYGAIPFYLMCGTTLGIAQSTAEARIVERRVTLRAAAA